MLVRVRSMPSTLHAHGRNVSSYLPMTSLQPHGCLGRHKCIQASEVATYGTFMGFWELLHVSLHRRSTSQGRFSTNIWLTPVILFKVQQMMNRRQRSLSRCSRPVVPRFDTQQPWNERLNRFTWLTVHHGYCKFIFSFLQVCAFRFFCVVSNLDPNPNMERWGDCSG